MTLERPEGFETFLKTLKERISSAQTRAALAVSRELLELYWTTGRDLEQITTGCGNFAVEPHHGIAFENQGLQSQLHFVAQAARQITAWTEEKR